MADGQGTTSAAVVTITIRGADDQPEAANDAAAIGENGVLDVPAPGVLTNDADADAGDTTAVVAVNGQTVAVGTQITLISGALLMMQANGSYRYDPNGKFEAIGAGQTATDSFAYTMADQHGATSSASVTITIQGANDAPAVLLTRTSAVPEGSPFSIGGSFADVDTG